MKRCLWLLTLLSLLPTNVMAGSYYFKGGYYGGDRYYSAGYYSAGYYSYPTYYEPSYYYSRVKVLIPLVETSGYGAYREPGVPKAPCDHEPKAETPAAKAPSAMEGKVDQLLSLTQSVVNDVKDLKVRVNALEAERELVRKGREADREALRRPQEPINKLPKEDTDPPDAPYKNPVRIDKCAACHSPSNAARDGGGFRLLDARGNLLALTKEQRDKAIGLVKTLKMPPKPGEKNKKGVTALSNEEVFQLIEDLKHAPVKASVPAKKGEK